MIFPVPQQNLVLARADFRIVEFRKLVQQKGLRLQWEQTVDCPCTIKTNNNFKLDLANISDVSAKFAGHNQACPVCNGKGLIRHSSQEIKGIITNATGDEKNDKSGIIKKDYVKITLEPEHLPSYGDKFTLKDSVIVWKEIVNMPNASDSIELQSQLVTRSLLLSTGVKDVNILYIHRSDSNGLAVLNGEIPETDYIVDLITNTIQFTNPLTRPVAGSRLVIAYYTNPTYIVDEYPHTIRDTFVRANNIENFSPMLVQVQCRMEIGKE